jgi:hypothetical protein
VSLLRVQTLAPRHHIGKTLIQMHDQTLGACRTCIFGRGLGIALNHPAALVQVKLLLDTLAALDHMLGVAPVDTPTCSCLKKL